MKKKIKKTKHRHTWDSIEDKCFNCGVWVRQCKKCFRVQEMSAKGEVLASYR